MFGIPERQKIVFARNFIDTVACKVSYEENRRCTSDRNTFVEGLKEYLPNVKDNETQTITFQGSPNGGFRSFSVDTNKDDHQLLLSSADAKFQLQVSNTDLVLKQSAGSYVSSVEYDKLMLKSIGILANCQVHTFNTLELRKVNLVNYEAKHQEDKVVDKGEGQAEDVFFPVQAIKRVINSHLLNMYENMGEVNVHLDQQIYSLRLKDGDYQLVIKYGLLVGENNEKEKCAKGQIPIDILIKKLTPTKVEDLEGTLTLCHQQLYNAYCWVLSNEFMENILN
jgi:uncharacterized protein (TIGR04255 family)